MDIVNDGEYGKSSWANYVLERLTGFEARPDRLFEAVWLGRDRIRFREFMKVHHPRGATTAARACVCRADHLHRAREHPPQHRRPDGRARGGRRRGRIPHRRRAGEHRLRRRERVLRHDRDYVFAIAEALREEYLEIVNAGLVLQVDDAVLAKCTTNSCRRVPTATAAWAEMRVEALNHALRGIPEDRIRYHICFGSWHVPHVADAPLGDIIDLMLPVNAGAYSIEAANVAARARVARVADGEAAVRQHAHSRRRDAPHDDGRAPAPRRRSDRAVCRPGRPGKRDRRHRLRFRPDRRPCSACTRR